MKLSHVGVDLAKNVFQLHGVDRRGKTVWRRRLRRHQWVQVLLATIDEDCVVGMEACGGAHHWARQLQSRGITVRLIAPQFVKPYVKSNKNDRNDAEAICEAMMRPSMRFVAVKTVDQQDIQAIVHMRSLLHSRVGRKWLMKRFIEGDDRNQRTLLPECLEDFVTEDNPVRVVDVFIDGLKLEQLGFDGALPAATGRPAYHPATLLKLYLYGYLNRVQSSRRLEREAQRNLELMWLLGRLAPDFKTIADFRKNNGKAIGGVCREFVGVCRRLELFSQALVAIDGSKFKAVNNRDNNFTEAKMKKRLERVENKRMQREPDKQLSLTDPDARSMATSGKGSGMVGYNVQTAVESKHHLIVAHEVTNVGHDRAQLAPMAERARAAMATEELSVVADRGYFSGTQIVDCEDDGIRTFVPKPLTSSGRKTGRFTKQDFVYEPEQDQYRCPAGEALKWRFVSVEDGLNLNVYSTTACKDCSIKAQCTTGCERRIKRWEREDVLDEMQARLDAAPEKMQVRRQTVEHPFGTLKAWMGATHL
jgi:transposase